MCSRSVYAIVDSILRQRFLDVIHPHRTNAPDAALIFESSVPSDPSRTLKHQLNFDSFHSIPNSCTLASFNFASYSDPDSAKVVLQLDATQSFETLLLNVSLSTGPRSRDDFCIAEGLERIWRSWWDFFDKEPDCEPASFDSGFADMHISPNEDRGKLVERKGLLSKDLSARSLSIDKTIASATLKLYPNSVNDERETSPFGRGLYHRLSNYKFVWKVCRIIIAAD